MYSLPQLTIYILVINKKRKKKEILRLALSVADTPLLYDFVVMGSFMSVLKIIV